MPVLKHRHAPNQGHLTGGNHGCTKTYCDPTSRAIPVARLKAHSFTARHFPRAITTSTVEPVSIDGRIPDHWIFSTAFVRRNGPTILNKSRRDGEPEDD